MAGNGELSVPPGFRFHPTDEELLYYYLRKKVSYEPIDLDVIREVDLNKLEPWDLKEKCRIGSGPQNDWYFFSHKDKKYPTGTRTNRATTAGFWKATGRDKAIHLTNSSRRIGMRKTLVFYTGRAPHGLKTDWIMHEYRLDDDNAQIQEDGWVICRVFMKKTHTRGFQLEPDQDDPAAPFQASEHQMPDPTRPSEFINNYAAYSSIHLPQLLSPDNQTLMIPSNHSFLSSPPLAPTFDHMQSSQNIQSRLTVPTGDWSFLDKLLANHHQNAETVGRSQATFSQVSDLVASQAQRIMPFPYSGFEPEFGRYSK